MTDLPHLRAFLRELAHLEAVDAEQLPVPLLAKMCRSLLRQPLLNVRLLATGRYHTALEASIEAEGVLDTRYPIMTEARLVQEHLVPSGFYAACTDRLSSKELDAELDRLVDLDTVAWELMGYSANGWSSSEVAVRLYQITCGEECAAALMPLVDAMLGLDPVVGQMLLDLAALTRTND